MSSLLILGAGGYGRVIEETAKAMFCYDEIAFLDDKEGKNAIGKLCEYLNYIDKFTCAYPAFGNNLLRMQWYGKLKDAGFCVPTIINSTAYISPSAKIGEGVVILANATVGASAELGNACIINSGVIVDHDCTIGECTHLAPGAIVKAGAVVEKMAKIESGEVVFASR